MGLSLDALETFIKDGGPLARIDIAAAKGSTPREEGVWMLVSQKGSFKTIGGGQLEYMAIDEARKLLACDDSNPRQMKVPLGPQIGQCCGGSVELLLRICDEDLLLESRRRFEAELEDRPSVYVFGAGHVGNAISEALALLPVRPILVDTRHSELASAPKTVETRLVAMPETEVRSAAPGSAFVILTHDHSLDFLIANEALARNDTAYVGMIGSKTKRATCAKWLQREGLKPENIDRLVCPIGGNDVADKRPEVIAALAIAEIVKALDRFGDRMQAVQESTKEPLVVDQFNATSIELQR